jgi:hypothetical protein
MTANQDETTVLANNAIGEIEKPSNLFFCHTHSSHILHIEIGAVFDLFDKALFAGGRTVAVAVHA